MDNWKEVKLGELASMIGEKTDIQNATLENYISTNNMLADFGGVVNAEKLPTVKRVNIFKINDTLFSNIRTYFKKVWFSSFEGTVSSDVIVFRANDTNELTEKFLYYRLCSNDFIDFTVLTSRGAKMPRGDKGAINNYDLLLPPLSEQKAIAEVLSSLDDKIDLLHRQNETLEQMAQTLFRQWFVEEAEEDWEEVYLNDLIEIKGGYSYKGKYIGEGTSLLLGMGCVSFNERFLHKGARLYSGKSPKNHLVKPGDLVLATRQQSENMPILGYPAIIPSEYRDKNVIVGTNLYRVINNSEFDNYFFYNLFKSQEYRRHIVSCSKGTTVKMITKDTVESFKFLKPPKGQIDKYREFSGGINNRIINILKQIQTLEKLRDTLLPKLMSGEAKVKI